MTGRVWAPGGPRLYFGLPPLLLGIGAIVLAIAPRSLPVAAVGAVFVALGVRGLRVALVLEADHALVRNPLRTYRVPYAEIDRVEEDALVLLGSEAHPWLGTSRLALDSVIVEATGWLPDAERVAVREEVLRLARSQIPPEEALDTSAPFPAVLRLLEQADPNPALVVGSRDGYGEVAEELAAALREGETLDPNDVAEFIGMEDDATDLTRRLNELR